MKQVLISISIIMAACSPRAAEPEHDVIVLPASDRGELRLALTGAAPSADALGVGAFLGGPKPTGLLGAAEGSPAPGTDAAPRVSQPLRDVADDRPGWDAWQTEPMPLHEAGRAWTTATLSWEREPGSAAGFRAARYPASWFGLDDWQWCEPVGEEWDCVSLDAAYYQRRLSCWVLGEPVDCLVAGPGGQRDLLVPHVVARAWVGEQVPTCAGPCDWLGVEAPMADPWSWGPDAGVTP